MTDRRTAEHARLRQQHEGNADWNRWGPYLADRAWGSVREDYSPDGKAWQSFPHDHARSRTFRWNEDGLAGICDDRQYLCLAPAFWNGHDPILKERLFGLTGPEGNHAEDVKERYFHVDATPTHSYLEFAYHYPQGPFPYGELVEENQRRGLLDREFELEDTTAFDDDRYFDIRVIYAKQSTDDVLMAIDVTNRGSETATCYVLPTLWYRNTWSWGYPDGPMGDVPGRPTMSAGPQDDDHRHIRSDHPTLGTHRLLIDTTDDLWFTENESNRSLLWDEPNPGPFTKDAFHARLIDAAEDAVNPAMLGSKAAFVRRLAIAPGETQRVRVRLTTSDASNQFDDFDSIIDVRRKEADAFHRSLLPPATPDDHALIHRRALAGMIWTKQLYYFDVEQWLDGDPAGPQPHRDLVRNGDWRHLNNFDIISMPDGWEYPWYAAWDLAFHAVTLAAADPEFAKLQLELMTREWYLHPNGQLPAYEWKFGDVNPPVHAWAVRRVFEIDAEFDGPDIAFLERVFHKLLINFTWWVNRKDADGNNVFQGGFLGLDNISVFDRSDDLPGGGHLDQSDATAWMAFFTLEMMGIALELAKTNPVYQDLATKFFEHFLSIATAMSAPDHCLWNDEDGFFYDVLRLPDRSSRPIEVRSLVGVLPLLAAMVIDDDVVEAHPAFAERMHWFLERKPHLSGNVASIEERGEGERHLAAILDGDHLRRMLRYVLDEEEFLSPFGIRSLSRFHADHPFSTEIAGREFRVSYEPGESESGMFGGNSNWRGPVWFPMNILIIEALDRLHSYFGDRFLVEYPTGSGTEVPLEEVADDLSRRLVSLFTEQGDGTRAYAGGPIDPGLILFHEYFNGDTGFGLGASHQTGWTGAVADLIRRLAD